MHRHLDGSDAHLAAHEARREPRVDVHGLPTNRHGELGVGELLPERSAYPQHRGHVHQPLVGVADLSHGHGVHARESRRGLDGGAHLLPEGDVFLHRERHASGVREADHLHNDVVSPVHVAVHAHRLRAHARLPGRQRREAGHVLLHRHHPGVQRGPHKHQPLPRAAPARHRQRAHRAHEHGELLHLWEDLHRLEHVQAQRVAAHGRACVEAVDGEMEEGESRRLTLQIEQRRLGGDVQAHRGESCVVQQHLDLHVLVLQRGDDKAFVGAHLHHALHHLLQAALPLGQQHAHARYGHHLHRHHRLEARDLIFEQHGGGALALGHELQIVAVHGSLDDGAVVHLGADVAGAP
mmetsp:Transcript_34702/g.66281  ORF Transcript_34702/g.66281 Transcript_34702/m.66281 type:complete len:351 (+) Transcript_34702:2132-3184(+)